MAVVPLGVKDWIKAPEGSLPNDVVSLAVVVDVLYAYSVKFVRRLILAEN